MCTVIDEARNIVLGHFWKLFLEKAFEAGKNDEAILGIVIIDHSKFDLAIPLLNNCRLWRSQKVFLDI
jgi:hypothetical protein